MVMLVQPSDVLTTAGRIAIELGMNIHFPQRMDANAFDDPDLSFSMSLKKTLMGRTFLKIHEGSTTLNFVSEAAS